MSMLEAVAHESVQDVINGRVYSRDDLVREYATQTLAPPESTAIARYHGDILDRRVLDLGCGAGRLATYLRPLVGHYVGLDISPHMVAFCRANFAGLEFQQSDMRRLSRCGDGSFDTVFAVFNLFDAVSHDDRLKTLAEVRRVLSPDGLLIFSSHNRNFASIGEGPRLQLSRNPLTQLRHLVHYLRCQRNYRRVRAHQSSHAECALVNDPGHNYAVLHYYISRQAQAGQLAAAGFRLLECLDESGRALDAHADDSAFCSLHYVARATR